MNAGDKKSQATLWSAFSSVRLAIFLLIIITILAILGTIIIQKDVEEVQKIKAYYSPSVFQFLDRLGLLEVYHSWWFRGAIFLLVINLIVCSLNKIPHTWKLAMHPKTQINEEFFTKLRYTNKIKIPKNLYQADERIKKAFQRMGLKARADIKEGKQTFFAQKYAFSRLGFLFTHFSLILLLFGVLISSIFSIKGYMGLLEGESANSIEMASNGMMMELPFTIRGDNCWVEYYEDMPEMEKDWFSELTIIENGKPVLTKTIQVNDPLIYHGYHFFQNSFAPRAQSILKQLIVTINSQDNTIEKYPVKVGDTIIYKPAQLEIKVLRFLPDFIMNGREAVSKSEELNNPAAFLQVTSSSGGTKNIWVFYKFPDFHKSSEEFPVNLGLEVVADFKNWTGLMVTKDPGLWLVWIGCGLITLSLIITFYFTHRRYWVMPTKDRKKRNVLLIGGSCRRSHRIIEEEFRSLVGNLEEEFKRK